MSAQQGSRESTPREPSPTMSSGMSRFSVLFVVFLYLGLVLTVLLRSSERTPFSVLCVALATLAVGAVVCGDVAFSWLRLRASIDSPGSADPCPRLAGLLRGVCRASVYVAELRPYVPPSGDGRGSTAGAHQGSHSRLARVSL